jgi:hypothetical protein
MGVSGSVAVCGNHLKSSLPLALALDKDLGECELLYGLRVDVNIVCIFCIICLYYLFVLFVVCISVG